MNVIILIIFTSYLLSTLNNLISIIQANLILGVLLSVLALLYLFGIVSTMYLIVHVLHKYSKRVDE